MKSNAPIMLYVLYAFGSPTHIWTFIQSCSSHLIFGVVTLLNFCIILQVLLHNRIKFYYDLPVVTSCSQVTALYPYTHISAIHAYQNFITSLIFALEEYRFVSNLTLTNLYLIKNWLHFHPETFYNTLHNVLANLLSYSRLSVLQCIECASATPSIQRIIDLTHCIGEWAVL